MPLPPFPLLTEGSSRATCPYRTSQSLWNPEWIQGVFLVFFSFDEGDAHTADPDKKWNPTNFFRTCMSEYSFMPYHDAWPCSYLRSKPFPTLCCFSGQAVYSYWWSLKRRVGEWEQAAHWRVSLPCLGLGLCPPAGPAPSCCSPKL